MWLLFRVHDERRLIGLQPECQIGHVEQTVRLLTFNQEGLVLVRGLEVFDLSELPKWLMRVIFAFVAFFRCTFASRGLFRPANSNVSSRNSSVNNGVKSNLFSA